MADPPTTCDGCGACCFTQGLWMLRQGRKGGSITLARLAQLKEIEAGPFADREFPCPALDLATGRCLDYNDRPLQCERFPMGGPACMEYREEMIRAEAGL